MDQVQSIPEGSCVAGNECGRREEVAKLRARIDVLEQQARTDPLTNLSNFRHFSECLEQEMERSRRTGYPCTLLMVDLDHFKSVNDNHGHETGNRALIQTAELIRQSLRKLDIPCRFGGEEFAIILPGTSLLDGEVVAERLRQSIAATPLTIEGGELAITASIGADVFTRRDRDTAESFIERVDQQLYRAKESGRNCVCCAPVAAVERKAQVSAPEKDALYDLFGNNSDNDN